MRDTKDIIDDLGEFPRCLIVMIPLPGLSDDNELPVFQILGDLKQNIEILETKYSIVSAKTQKTRWELVTFEVNENDKSIFDGIIVAFYKPVEN